MKRISKKYLQLKLFGKMGQEESYLKYVRIIFLGFFIFGIVYANILGEDKLTSFGILNEYFIEKFKFTSIRKDNLFFYILEQRLPMLILLLMLVFTTFRLIAGGIFIGWQGFSLGFLVSTALIKYGMKGLILIGGALFPQYLVYIPLYIIYLHLVIYLQKKLHDFKIDVSTSYSKSRTYGVCLFIVSIIFCAYVTGVFLESYVNPPLLKNLLKIF